MKPIYLVLAAMLGVPAHSFAAFAQQHKYDSLRVLLEEHPAPDARRAALLNELSFALHTTDPAKAMAYAEEAISFAGSLEDKRLLAGAYLRKGVALVVMSKYDDALALLEKALALERVNKHEAGMAAAISNIGLVHQHQNNYPLALKNYQEAAQLFTDIGNPNAPLIYNNMASIYAELKNYEKAIEYFGKAHEESMKYQLKPLEVVSVMNIGVTYVDRKAYHDGVRYLDSALRLNEAINDPTNSARIYGNLGVAYFGLEDYHHAEDYALRAWALNTQLGNERSLAYNANNLGENYLALGNLPEAYRYLARGLALGAKLEVPVIRRDIAQNLSAYFEQRQVYDSALYYQKLYTALQDSIGDASNQKELTRLELQYDFDLKEQGYLQQQQVHNLQMRQLWLYGALVLALLVALGSYLLNRARLRTVRMKNELREQELSQQTEALLLQQQLSESELKAIRTQMNPHFIFNVLNSIEFYILESDARTASKLVQRFAKLTRLVLENSTHSLVSADREWEAIRQYIELEMVRFDQAFDCHFEVDSALDLSKTLLPPMLIQPLVENAIHHGLRHVKGYRGVLKVSITRQECQLVICVADNGVGLHHSRTQAATIPFKEKSMGIAGIRERLEIIGLTYPESAPTLSYATHSHDGQLGTEARLTLPLM
ncbi:tetratricopeptide repeat protein [Parapedobacter koreensis]|uniref:Tetratricopeptide repeat-containing protein n=1 Tax=Parapedobacter koreensis TaxID=332977 RepID=A0A1H7QRJ7_9SPHI|nr:tetratricopeptide repeat protein [Parapedobacter koreensis]SEL50620.1 Tetratricopeptide repeat-containing protein [Parapedobacter koreensis]